MQSSQQSPLDTDETLVHIFSFFPKSPKALSTLPTVSKRWHNIAEDGALWRPLIKPAFLQELEASKLTAKKFYENNIHARIHTFYCIGEPLLVCKIPGLVSFFITNKKEEIVPTEKSLLSTLKSDETGCYSVFSDRNEAIACADALSASDIINEQTSIACIYKYPPIFTIHCDNLTFLDNTKESEILARKTSCHYGEDPFLHFKCYKINSAEKVKPHEIFYKTGSLYHKTTLHTVPVTQPTNQNRAQPSKCTVS